MQYPTDHSRRRELAYHIAKKFRDAEELIVLTPFNQALIDHALSPVMFDEDFAEVHCYALMSEGLDPSLFDSLKGVLRVHTNHFIELLELELA